MTPSLPKTMKIVQLPKTTLDLKEAIASLQIVEKPLPCPKWGEVLVKIEAAPCNPSDLLLLQGKYGVRKELPCVPGWEGAGTVVQNGGGALGWWLRGKRVACGGQTRGDGTWAEYFVARAASCIPLANDVPVEQGATLIINPLTAVGLLELARKGGHKAVVQTVAAGQVGRMVIKLAREAGMQTINIVRSEKQAALLQKEGAEIVLNSAAADFRKELSEISAKFAATIAFEAVAGEMTGIVLNALPPKATVVLYGGMSNQFCSGINPMKLIFESKKLESFWLSSWIREGGVYRVFKAARLVQKLMADGSFSTAIRVKAPFDQWKDALLAYQEEMSAGKVLLVPGE